MVNEGIEELQDAVQAMQMEAAAVQAVANQPHEV